MHTHATSTRAHPYETVRNLWSAHVLRGALIVVLNLMFCTCAARFARSAFALLDWRKSGVESSGMVQ
eukprot:3549707-Alexandrium_andersonii.AAC.1